MADTIELRCRFCKDSLIKINQQDLNKYTCYITLEHISLFCHNCRLVTYFNVLKLNKQFKPIKPKWFNKKGSKHD